MHYIHWYNRKYHQRNTSNRCKSIQTMNQIGRRLPKIVLTSKYPTINVVKLLSASTGPKEIWNQFRTIKMNEDINRETINIYGILWTYACGPSDIRLSTKTRNKTKTSVANVPSIPKMNQIFKASSDFEHISIARL